MPLSLGSRNQSLGASAASFANSSNRICSHGCSPCISRSRSCHSELCHGFAVRHFKRKDNIGNGLRRKRKTPLLAAEPSRTGGCGGRWGFPSRCNNASINCGFRSKQKRRRAKSYAVQVGRKTRQSQRSLPKGRWIVPALPTPQPQAGCAQHSTFSVTRYLPSRELGKRIQSRR